MKYNQFSISEIIFDSDQADQLRIDCINAIENYGIENFEKRTEIEVPYDDNDPLKASLQCCIKITYKPSKRSPFEFPDDAEIESRSVEFLSINLWTENGDLVRYKVNERDQFLASNYITIEEQVKSHFTI